MVQGGGAPWPNPLSFNSLIVVLTIISCVCSKISSYYCASIHRASSLWSISSWHGKISTFRLEWRICWKKLTPCHPPYLTWNMMILKAVTSNVLQIKILDDAVLQVFLISRKWCPRAVIEDENNRGRGRFGETQGLQYINIWHELWLKLWLSWYSLPIN